MAERRVKRAVLIAGPTASGKSALALARARQSGGVIINADAMQVYDVLQVVTARPSVAEMAEAPHRLYGFVPPSERFSTGAWRAAAADAMAEDDGRPLIFVGGTGLYFEALVNGFSDVPPVAAEIVAAVEREIAGLDAGGRLQMLAVRDPAMAARLRALDPQRVTRALAVLQATGRSLADYQDETQAGLLEGYEVERVVLNPDRKLLAERIAMRFERMFESGAVEEVETLLSLGLDPKLPAMKAIGVREIGAWLKGELSHAQAVERAVIATRQYAKRQRTWFRSSMADWTWIE